MAFSLLPRCHEEQRICEVHRDTEGVLYPFVTAELLTTIHYHGLKRFRRTTLHSYSALHTFRATNHFFLRFFRPSWKI